MSATERSPLEELQVAHKRLSDLRSAASGGYWRYRDDTLTLDGEFDNANVCVGLFNVAACGPGEALASENADVRNRTAQANADLIVTLHRTIDAQLSLLDVAYGTLYDDGNRSGTFLVTEALRLARAINGEAS